MKTFILLALCALAASAYALDEADRVNGENGWYVPQQDGTFEWVDKDVAEDWMEKQELLESRGLTTVPVTFYLYTSSNPTKGQKIKANYNSINNSNFNSGNPTRFVIHGWTQSYTAGMNKAIRNAWLSQGDYNVIVVDWARARSIDYATSVMAVAATGKKVANMINFLNSDFGMSLDNLYVIGHSLGAHVSGYAGRTPMARSTPSSAWTPHFPSSATTRPTSVSAPPTPGMWSPIQTNGGNLGFLKPIGKGAFYPNGGKTQPGCFLDVTGACSHGRSTTYYAEAVSQDNFGTIKCGDYQAAVNDQCGSTYSGVRMGADTNAYMVAGDFYVPVNSNSPYGMIN
ncbi:GL23623 [Drosophila persimilis]|uniref:GL23623 n=1 Tax=Drosophila persimilis TaxID=7234 RepID=B4G2E4_DROPE|nr:GL23623 [Drosophila persimilis]